MSAPRSEQDAYEAFMAMSQSEWLGLLSSLFCGGGVLTVVEQDGFDRAMDERKVLG